MKKMKKQLPKITAIVLGLGVCVLGYYGYHYAYTKGYAEGTNNQVICQASVSNPTLTKLCK